MKEIKLGKRLIGKQHRPYIIAEMSGNHNQSLDRALELVRAAAKTGVDALKIQTYTAETMTLDIKEGDFYINDQASLWHGQSLYNLYEQAYTPWEWHEPIFRLGRELGLDVFSTPFDETAVDFLESLNTPFYKIASFENTDLPLIRKVAATGKPIVISTGMATVGELAEAVSTVKEVGCEDLVLLKCTSTYPASPENSNILTIPHMQQLFNCQIGLSDHTLGIGVAIASIAMGATVIEKHFTIKRSDGGVDSAFSMEPEEFSSLVIESERAWLSMGKIQYGATGSEKKSLMFRRSIYVAKDIKAGEKLTNENCRVVRPGFGLPPKYYETLLGSTIKRDVKKGTPLQWELIK
ncbi:MAG: pseudaminic acid synthase [Gammaproteobacteria bacterium RIFCSPHIGHO2_12_FULL_35_23]|nr:MAG: pseudaminic acid synthase [Gammaproteobacteria bacterium RIFCSPHIGHO2_12_FULL_35_23]